MNPAGFKPQLVSTNSDRRPRRLRNQKITRTDLGQQPLAIFCRAPFPDRWSRFQGLRCRGIFCLAPTKRRHATATFRFLGWAAHLLITQQQKPAPQTSFSADAFHSPQASPPVTGKSEHDGQTAQSIGSPQLTPSTLLSSCSPGPRKQVMDDLP
jgi:hypothetical protein